MAYTDHTSHTHVTEEDLKRFNNAEVEDELEDEWIQAHLDGCEECQTLADKMLNEEFEDGDDEEEDDEDGDDEDDEDGLEDDGDLDIPEDAD